MDCTLLELYWQGSRVLLFFLGALLCHAELKMKNQHNMLSLPLFHLSLSLSLSLIRPPLSES